MQAYAASFISSISSVPCHSNPQGKSFRPNDGLCGSYPGNPNTRLLPACRQCGSYRVAEPDVVTTKEL